jgi:hypothetical protein
VDWPGRLPKAAKTKAMRMHRLFSWGAGCKRRANDIASPKTKMGYGGTVTHCMWIGGLEQSLKTLMNDGSWFLKIRNTATDAVKKTFSLRQPVSYLFKALRRHLAASNTMAPCF